MKKILGVFALAVVSGVFAVNGRKILNLAHVYAEKAQVRYQKLAIGVNIPAQAELTAPPRIAHAGGEIEGHMLTNSLEAMELSYSRGFRAFEIDLSLTSDGKVAAIHDWDITAERLLGNPGPRSSQQFESARILGRFTPLMLPGLAHWLRSHPDALLITDAKEDNLGILSKVAESFGEARRQVIPQAYFAREIIPIYELGFDRVILTLYRSGYRARELLAHLAQVPVFAVTMPEESGRGELPRQLRAFGVSTYVHTVNDERKLQELQANGVHEIYTDRLAPRKLDAIKRP